MVRWPRLNKKTTPPFWWSCGLLAAFVASCLVSLSRPSCGPAFGYSDHFTHMNTARLFPRVGLAIWQTPVERLLEPESRAEQALAPPDVRSALYGGEVFAVPGWPDDKPFAGSWTTIARPYPPGVLLLVAPIAALYHFTPLSFSGACHALILLFLACSHLAFHEVLRDLPDRDRRLYVAAGVVAYAYVTFWTLRGFYDPAAMIPLVACGRSLARRRWLGALALFALACFIHFRALFYVPWAVVAAWHVGAERAWQAWSPRGWLVAASAGVLGALSLFTFVLVRPVLGQVPLANPVHPGDLRAASVCLFGAAVALAAALFWRGRARLDLAMLGWLTLMIVSIRQLQAWHPFMFVPWIFAPAESNAVRFGRIQWALVTTVAVIL
jgi:hypothetical protein